jgi:hypothetical protein
MESAKAFEQWCLVEIFGHQKYAGLVTEQQIGGANFVRVDVPETARSKPFTKLFGASAIYSMTPIEEDVARVLAAQYDQRPVSVYELPAEVRQAMHAANRIAGSADPPERGAAPVFDFADDDFDDSPS